MPETKEIHPIFNHRWSPIIDWIVWSIISGIIITIAKRLGYGNLIYRYEFFVFIGIAILFGIATHIWRRLFYGTVSGMVVVEDRSILPQQFENIDLTLTTTNYKKKLKPVLTNIKGEYAYAVKVPLGCRFKLTAKYDNEDIITENIDKIEDVRWLFGIPYFGLPISSGNPKQFDIVVPKFTFTDFGNQ